MYRHNMNVLINTNTYYFISASDVPSDKIHIPIEYSFNIETYNRFRETHSYFIDVLMVEYLNRQTQNLCKERKLSCAHI